MNWTKMKLKVGQTIDVLENLEAFFLYPRTWILVQWMSNE